MRTKEQLDNLRKAFCMMPSIGPFALFMNDEMVEALANRLQYRIDQDYKSHWSLIVKFSEDKDKSWDQLSPEENVVFLFAF